MATWTVEHHPENRVKPWHVVGIGTWRSPTSRGALVRRWAFGYRTEEAANAKLEHHRDDYAALEVQE